MVEFKSSRPAGRPRGRLIFSGRANKQRTVTLGNNKTSTGRPGTLDARFSRLNDLKSQAEQRQSSNRADVLSRKRGVRVKSSADQDDQKKDSSKDKRKQKRRPRGRSVKLSSAERPTAVLVSSKPGRRRKPRRSQRSTAKEE